MSEQEALKRKITQRWNIIAGENRSPFPAGPKATAFAQLEYILLEAGLLARRRVRRAALTEEERQRQEEKEWLAGREEDNRMSLSEVVGRDHGE